MKLRLTGLALGGLIIICLLMVVGVLAPVIAPHDPKGITAQSFEEPSREHPLGANNIGQDIFSELIWGTRSSLAVAGGAAILAVALGLLLGASAALAGGWWDKALVALLDVMLAVPLFPLLLLVAALVGSSTIVLVVIIGVLMTPGIARIVRSQSLTQRQRGFVHAASGFGGGHLYVVRRHLAPAIGPLMASQFVTVAAISVFVEAGLRFLGLGDPSGASWGLMLNSALARQDIYFSPVWIWWVLPPGFAISLTVTGFMFVGLGLETQFNPRSLRSV